MGLANYVGVAPNMLARGQIGSLGFDLAVGELKPPVYLNLATIKDNSSIPRNFQFEPAPQNSFQKLKKEMTDKWQWAPSPAVQQAQPVGAGIS